MKKFFSLIVLLSAFTNAIIAQNDTMYVMKNGIVVGKFNVNTQVDSIIFYAVENSGCPTTVTDVQGNVYNTVVIGTQCWLKENLKVTKYNDNTSIPLVTLDASWSALTTPAYCWYSNNEAGYGNTYGVLYNWFAVNSSTNGGKNVCPAGWHVPTSAEWAALIDPLGGQYAAGGKLKETGTVNWQSPNTGATNESGFTGRPGGYRDPSGPFSGIRIGGSFWASNEKDAEKGYFVYLYNESIYALITNNLKKHGFSVRCIKD